MEVVPTDKNDDKNDDGASAMAVLSSSRDASMRMQRRALCIARLWVLAAMVIVTSTFLLLQDIAKEYSGIGCFIVTGSLGLPMLAHAAQDSRYMRSQIWKRAVRYMPLFAAINLGMGANCIAASARVGDGGMGIGARMLNGLLPDETTPSTLAALDTTFGIIFLALGAICIVFEVLMLSLLRATDERRLPPLNAMLRDQKASLRETLGNEKTAALSSVCFSGDNDAYWLQSAGYYKVPIGRAFDFYMMCMSLLLVSAGLAQQIGVLVPWLQGHIPLSIVLNVAVGCGNGPLLLGIMYSRPVRKRIQAWLARLGGRGMERAPRGGRTDGLQGARAGTRAC